MPNAQDCSCYSDYSMNVGNRNNIFCEHCGSKLVEKHEVTYLWCKHCGRRKIFIYKLCPKMITFFFGQFYWHSKDLQGIYPKGEKRF